MLFLGNWIDLYGIWGLLLLVIHMVLFCLFFIFVNNLCTHKNSFFPPYLMSSLLVMLGLWDFSQIRHRISIDLLGNKRVHIISGSQAPLKALSSREV